MNIVCLALVARASLTICDGMPFACNLEPKAHVYVPTEFVYLAFLRPCTHVTVCFLGNRYISYPSHYDYNPLDDAAEGLEEADFNGFDGQDKVRGG